MGDPHPWGGRTAALDEDTERVQQLPQEEAVLVRDDTAAGPPPLGPAVSRQSWGQRRGAGADTEGGGTLRAEDTPSWGLRKAHTMF